MLRRHFHLPSPALAIAILALVLGVSGAAYAATGGNFILGHSNSANQGTALSSGVTSAPSLSVTNSGGRPAARFTSNLGVAPFSVSNGTKVPNLNADKLDGIDSTGFVTAGPCAPFASCRGSNAGGAIAPVSGDSGTIALVPSLFSISYACPANLADEGVITYTNTSADTENVFAVSGGDNPVYQRLVAGETWDLPATAAGDSYVWQIQHPTLGLATINAAVANRVESNDCHFQVQAVVTWA